MLAASLLLVAPAAAAGRSCGDNEYSYAGVVTKRNAYGVRATLTALKAPHVVSGHVAAWIGVGGYGVGPNGTNEWLQVGLVAYEDGVTRLYYEVTKPGRWPRYVEVDPVVLPGKRRRVAVREMVRRPNYWRVWVDGRPVTRPIRLPGSHGAWAPMVTAESWNGGEGACNAFAFRFKRVAVAARPAEWRRVRVRRAWLMSDAGYRVRRWRGTIIAAARLWPTEPVDPVVTDDPVTGSENPAPATDEPPDTIAEPPMSSGPEPVVAEPDPAAAS